MYLDLDQKARTDGVFRHRLRQLSHDLNHFHRQAETNAKAITRYNDTLMEMIKFCRFNLVFLTPYFFPHYPAEKPLNFADYPFAYQMFNFQIDGFMVFKGSRQISKSTSFSARQLMNAQLLPGWASMYLCPRGNQLITYANKLRDLERSSRFYRVDHRFRKNLNYKEFPNKARIELVYALSSADNIRGKSCSEILLDECQGFDPDLEIEVRQIQSASTTRVTIYAGTSLTTDTFLESKYSISSQASWVMKCPAGHWNIPLIEFGVMDMIQPQGPCCYKCGQLLNVRMGQWMHADTHRAKIGLLGFHVPQIIVPSVVNNPSRWMEIYELKVRGPHNKFKQEILGIATEEGEREITMKQLENICNLGRDLRLLQERAATGRYMFVVSGCDWGGSDYIPDFKVKVSTTVHVIMGIKSSGQCDILHMRRYSGMKYDEISDDIIRNHKNYKANAIASDFGVGAVYNSRLRLFIPPEKHLIFNYTGPTAALIDEPHDNHLYNQWSLNKTESISLTYDAVRRGRIQCFAWEFAEAYLKDFMNMYRAPGERAGISGASTFIYRSSATKPNDTLQAVNYAFMLAKILMGEPMFSDVSLAVRLRNLISSAFGYSGSAPRAYSG